MDLFQYERKVRVYNIAKQICNVFSKFLGVKETVPQLKKHLKEEVEELLSAKNKKEMAFECADVIILCMRILIVSGYKDPLAIIDKKGKIVLNRLERGRPPRKKEPEAEVLHTTAEAICEIQKNPDTEFEQNSVFGVVVLKRSRNGGIVMTQKDSRFELVDFRFPVSEKKSWKKTK